MSTDRLLSSPQPPEHRDIPAMESCIPTLAQRFGVAHRDGQFALAEKLHRELFKLHFYKVQLFCERRILRMQTTLAIFESEDIAIEAWESVIRLIQNNNLEVMSESHFIRLLFRTAKHRFLDRLRRSMHRVSTVALERTSHDGSYTIEQDKELAHATSDRPIWLSDHPTLCLLQSLFAGEISFANACAVRPRRRAKVYMAAMLYILITETMIIETEVPPFVPYILAACGVQQQHWDAFTAAIGACEYPDFDAILAAANIVFSTTISSRRSISVLKYEFTQLIPHPRRRADAGYGYVQQPKATRRSRRVMPIPES